MADTSRRRRHVVKLYTQQDGKCFYCGTNNMFLRREVSKIYFRRNRNWVATFDHIVPASKGGTDRLSNGVCACGLCNRLRGNKSFEEFKANWKFYHDRYADKQRKKQADALRHQQKVTNKKEARSRHRKLMSAMNCYLIARFAVQVNRTVVDLFNDYVYSGEKV